MFLIWQICSSYQRRPLLLTQIENTNTINNYHHAVTTTTTTTDNTNTTNFAAETLGFKNTEDEMNVVMASSSSSNQSGQILTLNAKYRGVSYTVKISTDQSVADLKTTVLQRFQLLPTTCKKSEVDNSSLESYRLIYCGHPLNEKASLLGLNLENETNLLVIKIDPQNTLQLTSNGVAGIPPSNYFIYCPVCKSIQGSKLRTKCSRCSDLNSFLIHQNYEPGCREDLLSCPNVPGLCSNVHCKSPEAKFIFQCRQNHPLADSVPLKHIRNNARHITCITCEEVHTPIIVFPCDQEHTICLNCFNIYCVVCLNEQRFQQTKSYGYTLPCPARCPNSHIQESHHFHILGDEEYERYKRFATEHFLMDEGGVLCPNPKCGQGMLPETNSNTINCCSCQSEFCRMCFCDSHAGACGHQQPVEGSELPSLTSSDVLVKCQRERESLSVISQITKPCPKCKVKTEKNGGCNHMVCCRCKEEWCWICVKPWNGTCIADHWFD